MKSISKTRIRPKRSKTTELLSLAMLALLGACDTGEKADTITISVIGTADVHGALVPKNGAGGLDVFAGYINNLRNAQAAAGNAVILLDAGDMWQGTLESNLTEGATVVDAYNIIGYTAAAIGNHDFDFGPVGPNPTPVSDSDDPRGALKARAEEANFPLLTSNVIDDETGSPVDWPNVAPTTIVDIDGVRVGIVGATTEHTLATTIAQNTSGISIAPLIDSFTRYAAALREDGADIVLITVHAGGRCTDFDDPEDLSSCNPDSEIFRVANALPAGLVDLIVAGHTHQGIAHTVNGIPIISAFSSGRAFGRVDITYDRGQSAVVDRQIYPPQRICEYVEPSSGECSADAISATAATYAGAVVTVDPSLDSAIEVAADAVRDYKERPLGVESASEMKRSSNPGSAIGNLMTTILLDMSGGADIAIHNTVGGIRADLPAGPLTFGDVFEIFPFDNRSVTISLTGKELRTVFRHQLTGSRRRAGIAGARVVASCNGSTLDVALIRDGGETIMDDDVLTVATNDFLVSGGDDIFVPVTPPDGLVVGGESELFREQIAGWLVERGGILRAEDFYSEDSPKFDLPGETPVSCDAAP